MGKEAMRKGRKMIKVIILTKKLLFAVSNLKTFVTDDSNNIDGKDSNGSNDMDTMTSTTTNAKSRKSNNIETTMYHTCKCFVVLLCMVHTVCMYG